MHDDTSTIRALDGIRNGIDQPIAGSPDDISVPPEFTDEALALRFTAAHRERLRYVAAWGRWMIWNGTVWHPDETMHAFDLARGICRAASAECENNKAASAIASARTVAAVERLARADRAHAATAGQWDADPWLLNTPGGKLDLRTGKLRPNSPTDYLTKICGATPVGDCPRWLSFLQEITCGDDELIAYLQRWIGYTLTGIIREHAFTFLYGPGGNGKSVLLGTIAALLGDYATTALADVFTVGQHDHHPTALAALRGARMVMVTETEAGRPWAESRIKALTGGDEISARVMRGDPFTFCPVFKLWISGNHRPVLRNPDAAMRRRLHLVPLTFVPANPDHTLPEALKAELPGIFAWAIKGCLLWQRDGLNPPEAVIQASADYFKEQDSLGAWFSERCEQSPQNKVPSRQLYHDWKRWTEGRGEKAGTEKWFSEGMERIAGKKREKEGVMFIGVRLLPSETGAW